MLRGKEEMGMTHKLSAAQLRRGREALRDWVADGRDALTVSNRSLEIGLSKILDAISQSQPPAAEDNGMMNRWLGYEEKDGDR